MHKYSNIYLFFLSDLQVSIVISCWSSWWWGMEAPRWCPPALGGNPPTWRWEKPLQNCSKNRQTHQTHICVCIHIYIIEWYVWSSLFVSLENYLPKAIFFEVGKDNLSWVFVGGSNAKAEACCILIGMLVPALTCHLMFAHSPVNVPPMP